MRINVTELQTARQDAQRLLAEGNVGAAVARLDSALAEFEAGGLTSSPELTQVAAAAYCDSGSLHYVLGRLSLAINQMRRACATTESPGFDQGQRAIYLRNLATILNAARSFGPAIEAYEEARRIDDRVGGALRDLTDLSDVYSALRDSANSRRLLMEARDYAIERKMPPLVLANLANRLGKLDLTIDENLNSAEGWFKRSLEISSGACSPSLESKRLTATALYNLALVHRERGQYADAEALQRRAVSLYEWCDPGSIAVAQAIGFLALICLKRGSLDRAMRYYEQTIALIEADPYLRAPTARRSILSQHHSPYRDLVACMSGTPGKGEEASHGIAERLRARMISDIWVESVPGLLTDHNNGQGCLRDERRAGDRLIRAHRKAVQLWADDTSSTTEVRDAEEERTRCRHALIAAAAKTDSELPACATWLRPKARSLQDLQRCLRSDSVVLQYLVSHDACYLWIIKSESVEAVEIPVGQAALRRSITEVVLGPHDGREKDTRLSSLSDILLGRVPAASWRDVDRVLVVADLDLWRLPFEGLPLPGLSRPLGDGFRISYLPSGSAVCNLMEAGSDKSNPRTGRDLGIPDERTESADPKGRNAASWDDKPDAISHGLGVSVPGLSNPIYLPTSPDRANVMGNIVRGTGSGYSYIQLELVAALDDRNPLYSGLHAGAGESHAERDRILLDELATLELRADVVIIERLDVDASRGYEGDGLLALVHALFAAGARNVICPLIAQTEVTSLDRRILCLFRDGLNSGLAPGRAIGTARKRAMTEFASGLDWGRYVLFGLG